MGHIVLELTCIAHEPNSRERSPRPKKHATFALSKQTSAYPAHIRELDEDEDDKFLVQLASREETVRRVLAQLRRKYLSSGKTLHKHAVQTCPFWNATKPRPDTSRVSGLGAEEFRDLIFSDHGSTEIGETFGFLIV